MFEIHSRGFHFEVGRTTCTQERFQKCFCYGIYVASPYLLVKKCCISLVRALAPAFCDPCCVFPLHWPPSPCLFIETLLLWHVEIYAQLMGFKLPRPLDGCHANSCLSREGSWTHGGAWMVECDHSHCSHGKPWIVKRMQEGMSIVVAWWPFCICECIPGLYRRGSVVV